MKCFGIAHMFKGHVADVVDNLRKKYDEKTANAVGPHVTMAGPCDSDMTDEEVTSILSLVASKTRSFRLTIMNIDTFLPVSSTSFLRIKPKKRLITIHNKLVLKLGWEEAFPYHPHVTITEYLSPKETFEVVSKMRKNKFHETDILDSIALLQKNQVGKWILLQEFQLKNIEVNDLIK
jgi:2'-5' RNA ligase